MSWNILTALCGFLAFVFAALLGAKSFTIRQRESWPMLRLLDGKQPLLLVGMLVFGALTFGMRVRKPEPATESASAPVVADQVPSRPAADADRWADNLAGRDPAKLEVLPDAAYSGRYGMRIFGFGFDSGPSFVQDDTPEAETTYRAKFYARLNALRMGPEDDVELFTAYDDRERPQFKLVVRRAGERKRIRSVAFQDDSSPVEGAEVWLRDGFRSVEVEWRAAETHNAQNGYVHLWIDEAPASRCTDLDNSAGQVDFVRLGAVAGIGAATSGQIDLDEFGSWRTVRRDSAP